MMNRVPFELHIFSIPESLVYIKISVECNCSLLYSSDADTAEVQTAHLIGAIVKGTHALNCLIKSDF